jgi:DNA helicase-2/ATP-dependent DNA helicase PcrA
LISEPLEGYGYQVGQNVNHASFGKGIIKNIEGLGDTARITIRFEAGEKKLVAKYANLGVIDIGGS